MKKIKKPRLAWALVTVEFPSYGDSSMKRVVQYDRTTGKIWKKHCPINNLRLLFKRYDDTFYYGCGYHERNKMCNDLAFGRLNLGRRIND